MKRPKDSELFWITWWDAVGESTRFHEESLKDCQLVKNTNLGWIVERNETRIVLAHGWCGSGEVDVFVIPVNCIVEMEPVRKPRKRRGQPTNG